MSFTNLTILMKNIKGNKMRKLSQKKIQDKVWRLV